MVLNAENRVLLVSHALNCPVVQVDLRDLNLIWTHAFWIDRKSMILRCD